MLIILEGPDLAGKTTLADKYRLWAHAEGIAPHNVHKGPLLATQDPEEEYTLKGDLLEKAHSDNHQHLVIIDRWYPSELVYAPIFRDGSRIAPEALARLALSIPQGSILQLILPPVSELVRRFRARGDGYVKEGHLERIHRAYDDLFTAHLQEQGWEIYREI